MEKKKRIFQKSLCCQILSQLFKIFKKTIAGKTDLFETSMAAFLKKNKLKKHSIVALQLPCCSWSFTPRCSFLLLSGGHPYPAAWTRDVYVGLFLEGIIFDLSLLSPPPCLSLTWNNLCSLIQTFTHLTLGEVTLSL